MVEIIFLIVGGVGAYIYFCIIKPWQYWKDRNVDQATISYILKNSYNFFAKKISMAEANVEGYKLFPNTRYMGAYQFTKPVLLIKDPDLIKDVTVKSFDHFMDHTNQISQNADPLWTKNLLSLRGQKWRDMRAILSPSFTSSKMRTMFTLMLECSQNFTEHFLRKDEKIIEIEMKDIFSRFTNDVIATTAFGLKVDSLQEPENEFYFMGKEVTNFGGFFRTFKFILLILFPKVAQALKISFISKRIRTFFTSLIDNTIKIREEKRIVRPDMIHLMMEARKGVQYKEENFVSEGFAAVKENVIISGNNSPTELTNMDITAQALIFFLAGFETVSTTMCFMGYELAANPDYQQRLRIEILEALDENNGKITYEALLKLKYMDMFLSESLRKWPAATLTERQCTKPYTISPQRPDETAVHIEKGFTIWLPVFAIHRDPKYYANPEKFDPERFNEENRVKINPYTYFPFGLGPRNCIGSRFALLEIKVLFFSLLQHFEIVPVETSKIPLTISRNNINLSSEGGFWFGLKRIKS